VCVCVCVCVSYHLHGLCEDDAVQPDEVLVAQRVHGVHLSDEIVQTVRVQHAGLQTLHRHGQLDRREEGGRGLARPASLWRSVFLAPSHHSAVGPGPLSSPHHSEGAVAQTLQQLKLRLPDQAGERGARVAAGRRRAGGRRPRGEGLLGVGVGSLDRKHLRRNRRSSETNM